MIALDYLEDDLSEWFVFGELGLNGAVKENIQLYPLMLSLANQKLISKAIVPHASLSKLSKIPNIEFYGVKTLQEAITLLKNQTTASPSINAGGIEYPYYEINSEKYYYLKEYEDDFLDVKGQEVAKRSAIVAAAGFHNILFEGSPGCGKSMIAKRLRYILPPLKNDEILDIAKLETLDFKEPAFKPKRSFRSPHHSSTLASVFGGGCHFQQTLLQSTKLYYKKSKENNTSP